MSGAAKKVVTFGELLLRLDPPPYERLVQAEQFKARYTGAEANAAVSLAGFGVEAVAVSKVPSHEIGQACVNYLRRYGVNTDFIVRGGERLGLLFVDTGCSQRPSKVIYDRSHSSMREARPEEFDWGAILDGAHWFHFSGTAPALGDNVLAVLRDGLRAARRGGVKVSCDCNYRSKLWSIEDASRVLTALMEHVNVFIGARADAEKLFGIQVERVGSEVEACTRTAPRLQQRFGFEWVAFTMRESLSASVNRLAGLLCDGAKCCVSRTCEMQIVDRVGGGDAFTAGLIYGLLCGFDPQRTIEFAAAASCLKHTIPGDFNLVSVSEVEQLLSGDSSGRVQR
jgi:2-dehydro-3-deoxygluconokinase